MVEISLAAEPVLKVGVVAITNSILTTWLVMGLVSILALLSTRRLSLVPGNGQSIAEIFIGGIESLFTSVLGEKIKQFFPLLATLFLFIMSLNWAGLVPGVGTIGFKEVKDGHEAFIPLFRSGTADLNMTIALALIVILVVQWTGLRSHGLPYLGKFINVKSPIGFFVGILELISEFSRIISFTFRLFGNVFAGEVLLAVIAFLIPVIAPVPFLGLELFVGFIQALVFSMLTAVFLLLAMHKEH